jgi:hypothetical protein
MLHRRPTCRQIADALAIPIQRARQLVAAGEDWIAFFDAKRARKRPKKPTRIRSGKLPAPR